jgi:hypothetical protein
VQVKSCPQPNSIFEPHTDLIKRGKVKTPSATRCFCHKVFLAESEHETPGTKSMSPLRSNIIATSSGKGTETEALLTPNEFFLFTIFSS